MIKLPQIIYGSVPMSVLYPPYYKLDKNNKNRQYNHCKTKTKNHPKNKLSRNRF